MIEKTSLFVSVLSTNWIKMSNTPDVGVTAVLGVKGEVNPCEKRELILYKSKCTCVNV